MLVPRLGLAVSLFQQGVAGRPRSTQKAASPGLGEPPADRPRRGGPVRGAVTWLDIRLAASQESSPRPISTPGRSRRHCSGWVSGVWGGRCWSVFTACWLCSEKI